ncbi:MAG: HNH endonuclease [Desulfobacterales bacterium]|nr:HNH endonuclease [Pseudomonadota bacterium]MCG2770657.1 HNH endonuclease [Desulfobacterales bacterium]
MSVELKDIKLLWGRAANRCSFTGCRIKLSQDKKKASESFPIGEQAHIVGREERSARSKSILSIEDRDSYHNLILLCPNHHTIIDKNQEDYPIEKLHMMKSQHEYWVETTLSESHDLKTKASDIIYANLIDMAVEDCSFSTWENWISVLYGPSHVIKKTLHNKILNYTLKMYKAVWPGTLPELESAMKLFSNIMNIMLQFYMKNTDIKEDYFIEDRSYKKQRLPEAIFNELSEKRKCWENYLDELIIEVVKAANWLADLVRRDINPLFMAIDGKFSLVWGPDDDFSYNTIVPEYSIDEKNQLIDSYEEKCMYLITGLKIRLVRSRRYLVGAP